MATVIEMPKMSDTMDSGILVSWKKQEGERIESGEVLAEVESDKATMELEAYESGVLRKCLAKVGEPVPVGDPIAIIAASADEDIGSILAGLEKRTGKPAAKPAEAPPVAPAAKAATPALQASASAPAASSATPGRVSASPLAVRMAQEAGLDLSLIKGSGPEGRIIKRDIERALAGGMPKTAPIGLIPTTPIAKLGTTGAEYEDIPISSMRKTIASRLVDSKSQIPHYYVTIEVDMEQAMRLREQLNALEEVKVSVNDFALKAAALALRKHPIMNASYQGGYIRVYNRIDIGMAVAMEDGLITPVIRGIDKKGLREISEQARALAERARAKRLRPEEFTGSTFTVSNLGMLGVQHFTAVINPPEAGILAIGAVRDVPVVKDGQIVVGRRMNVTLSSDHRVVDGAQSARFLKDFKYFIENPITFAL